MSGNNTSRQECSRQDCEHWEAATPAFHGHCSHASCPNYMEACPRHQTALVL